MTAILSKVSAITIILGSVFFLIAAFSPVSRVFGEPSAERKLEIILAHPEAWTFAQIMFAAGAITTAIGVGLAGFHARGQSFASLVGASVVLLSFGALLWTWHVYVRAVDPAAFTERLMSVWPFALYTVCTQAGLAIFGAALLRSELPAWVGWTLIGSMAFFFLLTVIFRDMPPFVYYLVTLLTGVMLYRAESLVAA